MSLDIKQVTEAFRYILENTPRVRVPGYSDQLKVSDLEDVQVLAMAIDMELSGLLDANDCLIDWDKYTTVGPSHKRLLKRLEGML